MVWQGPPAATHHFGRVMIFIDGPNFYRGILETHGVRAPIINYQMFTHHLVNPNFKALVRGHFYDSRATGPAGEKSSEKNLTSDERKTLHEKLLQTPYFQLHLPEVDHKQSAVKEDVDVRLAVDMVRFAANKLYEVALLITSDEDFVPAIRAVKDFGCQVQLVYVGGRTNQRLLDSADTRQEIGVFLKSDQVLPKPQ